MFYSASTAQSALATQEYIGTVRSFDDYVEIKHFTTRRGLTCSTPVRVLRAEALTIQAKVNDEIISTNQTICQLYADAENLKRKNLEADVIPDKDYWKIAIAYRGNVVILESGKLVDDKRFSTYRKDWNALYARVFQFVAGDMNG